MRNNTQQVLLVFYRKTPVPCHLLACNYTEFHDVQVDEGFDAICVHRDGVLGFVECELDLFHGFLSLAANDFAAELGRSLFFAGMC